MGKQKKPAVLLYYPDICRLMDAELVNNWGTGKLCLKTAEAQRDDTYQKMLDAYEPLIQQAKEEVFEEIENSGLLISGYNSKGFLTDKTQRWQALKSKHLKG